MGTRYPLGWISRRFSRRGDGWYACAAGMPLYQQVLNTGGYDEMDIGAQHGAGWESGMDNAAASAFIEPGSAQALRRQGLWRGS